MSWTWIGTPLILSLVQYKNDIAAFFREKHPDPGAEFGFSAEVMDTYIKSLAGYSVITYLLGIVSEGRALL